MMDRRVDGAEEVEADRSPSPTGSHSPVMDRNPSPPPETTGGDEDGDLDAIGDTVYSKHWLFSTLTRLINMVTEHLEMETEGQMELSDDDEEDLCRVWDMAMDKDVAGFLQKFKATEILVGVISKSRCPRLTEICVGILGNIACFPETCLTLSQNDSLGAVLLLLLGDPDPPTLLETSRLLLTCVSHQDVCPLWLQRIQQQTSVCSNLCFIMSSSTNTDLLEKVGELVEKLFDADEELMKSWITARPGEEDDDAESRPDVVVCLLEAAKQLRSESSNGLQVYLHTLQLLTTVDEGLRSFAAPDGAGNQVWDFVCAVVCEDLCQPSDLSVVLHEQKSTLVQAFAVLQALFTCQDQWCSNSEKIPPLIGNMLRLLQIRSESKPDDGDEDEQLETLSEIMAEFLSDICLLISKETVADSVKNGYLTEKTLLTAAASLVPNFNTSFQQLLSVLSEADPQLADVLKKQFPV